MKEIGMRSIIGQGERQHKRIYIMQGSKLYVGNLNYAVTEEQLKKVEKAAPVKWKLKIPSKEIYTKEELKKFMHELGGTWYGDN